MQRRSYSSSPAGVPAVAIAVLLLLHGTVTAGPFLLQSGSNTTASTDLGLDDSALPGPPPVYADEDVGNDANSTRSSSLGPNSYGGASGSASSTVTSSFTDSLISIVGSATASANTVGITADATNSGDISGTIVFKVDTAGTYRIYGSFLNTADGHSSSAAAASLSLNSETPYNLYSLDSPGGGSTSLSFDDLVTLNTLATYTLNYNAFANPISQFGAGASSAAMDFEAYLEFQPAAVPEPSSLLLVGGATCVGAYVRRRKRNRAAADRPVVDDAVAY